MTPVFYFHTENALTLCDSLKRMQAGKQAHMGHWQMERQKDETIIMLVKNVSVAIKNMCEHVCVQVSICTVCVSASSEAAL